MPTTRKKAAKKKRAKKKNTVRRASKPASTTGPYSAGSSAGASDLVQTKAFFQRSILRELQAVVSGTQLDDRQYSQSIFIEHAVRRELDRVAALGGIPESERTRP